MKIDVLRRLCLQSSSKPGFPVYGIHVGCQ